MEISPQFDAAFRARLHDLLRWRRDVRHFRPDPLTPGLLDLLLDEAALAPSVGLSEPWRWVIVDDPARRAGIIANFQAANQAALTDQAAAGRAGDYARLKLAGLREAPVHLAVFVDPDPVQGGGLGRRSMPQTLDYSGAMAIHTLWLVARAHGVGMGWVSILDPFSIAAILDVPVDWHFIGYLCLGYPVADEVTPELQREGWEHRHPPEQARLRR